MPLSVGNRLQDSAEAIANQAKWEAANPTRSFEDLSDTVKRKIWNTGNIKLGKVNIWDWKWKAPNTSYYKLLDGPIVYFGKRYKDGVRVPYQIKQKAGETTAKFYKRVAASVAEGRQQGRIAQTKVQIALRKKIDAWSTKWLKDNISKYTPRQVNQWLNKFKAAWKKEAAAQGYVVTSSFKPTHRSGFPTLFRSNVSLAKQPFKFEGFIMDPANPDLGLRKGFFKNKVRTDDLFKQKLDEYFEYILKNKSGLNNQFKQTGKLPSGMGDVVYWMSPDSLGTPPSGVFGVARTAMFRGLGKGYEKKFKDYIAKTNRSNRARLENFELLEKKLGLPKYSVTTMMKKEGEALRKLFDIKQLPPEFHGYNLGYSVEHTQGLAAALKSNNMNLIRQAHKDLAGMTNARNMELGWYSGFEKMRGQYIRDIEAGLKEGANVTKDLNKLNKMVSGEYKSWGGVPKEIYSIANNKLKTSRISAATTPKQRFAQYFSDLAVDPVGARALAHRLKGSSELLDFIKKSPGNILMTIGKTLKCPVAGAAEGGRIGLATGTSLINCISTKVNNDPIGSSQKISLIEESSGAMNKVKNAAKGFLGALGKWGPKVGKYGAIAAAGALAQPAYDMVRQFVNDDPSTYLTDPEQMEKMLLSTIEAERTPKPRSEILDWSHTAGTVGATGAVIPGTGRMYDYRRGLLEAKIPKAGPVSEAGLTAGDYLKKHGKGYGKLRAGAGVGMKLLSGMFTPAGILATEPLRIAQMRREGESWGEVAKSPTLWMGPAFADTMTKMATAGMKPGSKLARALSLGMSRPMLKKISRRFGMPGLLASAGLSGYDLWQDYKKKRGFFARDEE